MLQINLCQATMELAGATLSNELRGTGQHRYSQVVLTLGKQSFNVSPNGDITLHGGDILSDAPAGVEKFITEVSYYDNFGYGLLPRRQIGKYLFRSASAELQVIDGGRGQSSHYHVKVRGKRVADVRQLYELIRHGKIWPALDYEVEQVPPPLRHFRGSMKELWQLLRRDVSDRLTRFGSRLQSS